MRSLRDRLAQFDRKATLPTATSDRPARTGGARKSRVLDALLREGASWVGEGATRHLRIERELGDAPVPLETIDVRAWTLFGVDPPLTDRWTILDTETTGLESGTGTLVFLIGLVHWTTEGARLVQLFMPEPAAESGMLAALDDELAATDALISYNGRSFDVARLRSRLRLSRLPEDMLERPHLDLLHPSRRLFRKDLDDLRQPTLEAALLRTTREGDLSGEFAPEAYRSWLADGDDEGLRGVIEHNALDVERLLLLACRFAELLRDPELLPSDHARLAFARLCLQRHTLVEAHAWLQRLSTSRVRTVRLQALRELARLHRRHADFEGAARAWRDVLRESPHDVTAHVELAKLCEHRLHDLDEAQATVLKALRAASDRRQLDMAPGPISPHHLGHRLERIRKKIQRKENRVRGH